MSDLHKRLTELSPQQLALLQKRLSRAGAQTKAPPYPQIEALRRSERTFPLSFAQQRLWFLDQLDPGDSAYNIPAHISLSGPLDEAALQQSLTELVRRHESLRTSFAVVDGEPVQIIEEPLVVPLLVLDLEQPGTTEQADQVHRIAISETRRPFNLAHAPMMRACLLRLAPAEHVLLLTIHHIACDGWSIEILMQEVAALYTAFTKHQPSPLPQLSIQYVDFAHWQRERFRDNALQLQLDYWRKQLAGAPTTLDLPTDYPRPPIRSTRGATHSLQMSAPLRDALLRLSQREGSTLFMTLLAAFQILLARYTQSTDIVVGSPVAGRPRPELEKLIGFFVNTLVLRTDLSGNPSFRTLLGRVRSVALAAYEHQDIPFEQLVEELQPERSLSYPPLVQVLFTLQNYPTAMVAESGLQISLLLIDPGVADFDLALEIYQVDQGLRAAFTYNTDLFDTATVRRMAGQWQTLLGSIVTNPEQPVAALPLLTSAELQQALVEWASPDVAMLGSAALLPPDELTANGCLPAMFERQAAQVAAEVALVDGTHQLTYQQLNAQANQLARHLQHLGVKPETRVAVYLPRSIDLIVGLLAILKAGGVYVPLDPEYPQARIQFMLTDSQARVLLTSAEQRAGLPTFGGTAVEIDAQRTEITEQSIENLAPSALGGHLAYVIYTSGSTGQPKGVGVSYAAITRHCQIMQQVWQLRAQDCVLQFASPSFDVSLEQMLPTLLSGARLVLRAAELWSPLEFTEFLAVAALTVVDLPPVYWHEWVRLVAQSPGLPVPERLRLVIVGGDVLTPEAVRMWQSTPLRHIRLLNAYGPTEATITATVFDLLEGPTGGIDRRSIPIGRAIPGRRSYILDQSGALTPVGVPGELYLGGPLLAQGYLNQPALTAARFVPDPFAPEVQGGRLYRTGDLARYLPDGTIDLLGRNDQQVKLRGFRIELGELGAVLSQYPDIRVAIALVHTDIGGNKQLVAYLVADPALDEVALRAWLRTRLPAYMLPSTLVRLDALPLTPNGKVDRAALPIPDGARPAQEQALVAPRTPAEAVLVALWSEVLGTTHIGVHDNFFEHGGHSLLATQLVSRVRDALQVNVPLREVFAAPTVAQMAELIKIIRAGNQAPDDAPPLRPCDHTGPQPLSFAQQRMWFLHQLAPDSPLYTIWAALRIVGRLEVSAFARSLNAMISRHETLRTTFKLVEGQPVQVIAAPTPIDVPYVDLRALPADERDAAARQLIMQEVQQPFDLARGPLLRVTLLQLDDTEAIVLFSTHHIISDGWSTSMIVDELGQFYSAFARGEELSLPELRIQYADFAIWQRAWLQGEVLERQMRYWTAQLGSENPRGAVPLLDLPTDRPRPLVQTYIGKSLGFTLPQPLTDALTALSQREQVTPFMTLLAAFQLLLFRYTGQDDISIGMPIANRNRTEIEPLIGCFINTLVIRTDLSGAPSFRELLARVRQSTLGAYDHQDLPFEVLVDALQPARQLSYTPLFQAMFVMQNTPMQPLDLPDAQLSMIQFETSTAKTDLTLEIVPIGATFAGNFEYNTDLFDQDTLERMLGHFMTLLEGVVADPEETIARLPLLTDAEQRNVLETWNATAAPYPGHLCIHQLFELQAMRTPDAIALVCGAAQISYAELNRRANQVAHYVRRIGIAPGVQVGLCLHRSVELVVGLLGILKAGTAYVPLDPTYPSDRLAFMLDDARLPLVLTTAALETTLSHLPTRLVYLDCAWATIAQEPSANLPILSTPDHLAYTIYTSGSTGQPKGASVYQRGVVNLLSWFTHEFALSAQDRVLILSSLSFDLTQKNVFAPLIVGGQLHLLTTELYDVVHITQYLAEHQITLINCTPSAFYPLVEQAGGQAVKRLASLRYVFLGGEPIAAARLEAWAAEHQGSTALVNTYGPTECTDIASFYRVEHLAHFHDAPIPIGYPIANTQIFVLDRQGQPVAVGVVGELYVGGVGLGQGYLNRPALTAEKFVPHPFSTEQAGARFYRTGDLVRYKPDGAIEFVGRIDHQVKVRGFRIELGEIEAVLRQHPALREAVVLTREDTPGDQRLVAYLVSRSTPAPAVSEVRSFLKARLPEYMIPAACVYLDTLPLTPNGKIDRKGLPGPELTHAELDRIYVAPRTDLERLLVGLWSEYLHVERVGIHDSFFELGGNSIQGAMFINRLQELLGEYVSVVALFESPTIAELTSYLVGHHRAALARTQLHSDAREDHAKQASVAMHGQFDQLLPVPRDEGALLPLSFAQQRLWFLNQMEPDSPLYNTPINVRLLGKLDLDALQGSIDALIQRHEVLRTTFAAVEGQPVQIIAPEAHISLATVDLRMVPPTERDATARQLATEEAQLPFDLECGSLIRVTLVVLDTDQHVLLFTLHHIITDNWSMDVLIREFAAVYVARVQQRPVMLAALPVQYADFAVWQRAWLQGPLLAQQVAYWKDQLRGAPAALDLPTDRPRPPIQTFCGATMPFTLSPALSQSLQALSQREGVTLFMTLLASFQTLLFRFSGQTDILVGAPITNRTRQELEGVIGFFVNTVVLRTDLSGNPRFTELLARVRQVALGAYAHQDLPFEYLVEVLQPERDLSRSPLFQVMLVIQNAPAAPLELPDLTLEPINTHSGTAKFDLLLSFVEHPDGLVGDLEYNTDLFDYTTITRLMGHFTTLLEGIVANPAQPIAGLPLLADTERQQQLVAWNATAAPYPPLGVHQLVEQQASRSPETVAVVFGDQHLTYRDLESRANQLAHYLRTLGVGTNVLVGLCMERSLELVVGMLGVLKAGGAYLPLDPHYPARRLQLMLDNARALVVLTGPSTVAAPLTWLSDHFVGAIIDLVSDWPVISQQPTHAPESAVDLDQLVYVLYTSGSTGMPKGVAMPHRPLVNLIVWQQAVIPGPARTLQFASPSFDVSFQEIFTTWASGGTLVLLPEALRRDPEALAAFLDDLRIERLFMPFVALQQLAESLQGDVRVPAYLRDVITAGEQLHITPAITEWFRTSPRCRLHNHYGPTETHAVTAYMLDRDPTRWPALPPIGRPIANTQVYLLDKADQPLPIGAVGDLYLGGDCLAQGYLHRPELTAERFITLEIEGVASGRAVRLYKTGDLARYRPDGVLEFLGRADTQVKIRGYRIELGEIEHVLAQQAVVREAVVVARPNARGVTQLVGYVVPDGRTLSASDEHLPAELRAYLKEKLPDFMVPSAFVVLERWPLTPSGKIDRRALPAPGNDSTGTSDTFVAPRDTLELRLARIWEALLDIQAVGVRDNFFELGGHSLLVVRLMAQIQAQIGQKIPLATLFQEPTIEHLARTLRQRSTKLLDTPLIVVQGGRGKLPFFCVHPAAGSVLSYLELARLLGPDQPFYGFQAVGLEGQQAPRATVEDMAAVYLAALQTAQPEGPYLLGGWSFGGMVAYEMARRLTAQGHQVALLALFDSWAPTLEPLPQVDQTALLTWFAQDLSRTFDADLPISADTLAAVAPEQRVQYVLDQARAAGVLPPDIGAREVSAYLDVFATNLRAMYTYQPQPYGGQVTLFRADDQPRGAASETLGWEALAAEGVRLRVIPGDHYTIMRQPHVATLAGELRASLDEAQTVLEAHAVDRSG